MHPVFSIVQLSYKRNESRVVSLSLSGFKLATSPIA